MHRAYARQPEPGDAAQWERRYVLGTFATGLLWAYAASGANSFALADLAQAAATRRFASSQIGNFQQRLEQLHGQSGTAGHRNGITLASREPCPDNRFYAIEHPCHASNRSRWRDAGTDDRLARMDEADGDMGPDGTPTGFGTWAGGTGADPFVVTFGEDATLARVQTLMRALVYDNSSQDPTQAARFYSLVVTDGAVNIFPTLEDKVDIIQNAIDLCHAMGAEARVVGASQDEAHEEAVRLVEQEGLAMVPPFDDLRVIAGQGTLGLELVEDVPDVGTVLIPLSGGGLLAGVAGAMKALRPGLRVIGVSMERGAAMAASLEAGKPVPVEELPTLADSLGGGVGLDNRYTLAMVRDLADEVVLVSEAEIAEGIRHCYFHERQIVEGAAAVGVAALLAGKAEARGPTIVLLSGGNIDMALHARLVAGDNPDLMQEA